MMMQQSGGGARYGHTGNRAEGTEQGGGLTVQWTGQDSKPAELLKQGAQQGGTTCPTVTCTPPLPPTASERETASSWGHPQPYHSLPVFS